MRPIPDSNVLEAAMFHDRLQRLVRDHGEGESDRRTFRAGDVTVVEDHYSLKVYVSSFLRLAYSWEATSEDRVKITYRRKLVKQAEDELNRVLVLDELANA
jgi:hypothetical protein